MMDLIYNMWRFTCLMLQAVASQGSTRPKFPERIENVGNTQVT
ncbi:hypothetical protein [Acidithiobacillus ferriphilus]|nr:hypothetical protein [Acidithiobacillus ferriphilus]WCE93450.1 hypothetical protein PJU76_10865 [Acidithiobacillus ferriphilus]